MLLSLLASETEATEFSCALSRGRSSAQRSKLEKRNQTSGQRKKMFILYDLSECSYGVRSTFNLLGVCVTLCYNVAKPSYVRGFSKWTLPRSCFVNNTCFRVKTS